jgi:glycosyltransferase involved in cell wall biosynthesis
MRLIVCSSNYPNPLEPNKGIFNGRRIRALAERTELTVVAPVPYFPKALPSQRYGQFAQIPHSAVLDGVRVHYPRVLVTPGFGRSLYGLFYAAGLLRPMARLIKECRPQAILAFWAYPDGVGAVLLSRWFKLPVFVCAMGCDVNNLDQHLGKRRMVGWAFRRSNGALAVSRALGSRIAGLGVDPVKIRVVPNGLDDAYLEQVVDGSDSRSSRGAGATVLYCGRLSPEKDPLCLMEAARLLFAKRPDVRLTFVGDGPLRPRIEELATAWKIADRVALVGEVRHDQIAQHMRQADVLCLPSLREGYPNVLLEALACGLPIVATNVGGVPEIVSDERLGILVPTGQPGELAQALDTALCRNWDRHAMREAVRGRSWHDVASEILDFMERNIR